MIAWMFPGQGSQFVGMGAGLNAEPARDVFARARDVLGVDVRARCVRGPAELLSATEVAQPAIFTVSVAAARTLETHGTLPDFTVGHSLGEFAALASVYAVHFEEALRAVAVRAEAMGRVARTHPGGMVAIIGLDARALDEICRRSNGVVGVANVNAPDQVVISGEEAALGETVAKATERGARRAVRLNVGAATHTSLMAPAVPPLRRVLDGATWLAPLAPVVSTITAEIYTDPGEFPALLARALTEPVRWTDAVHRLVAEGVQTFVEVGPGRVLAGLVRRIAPEARVLTAGDDEAIAAIVAGRQRVGDRP